MPVNALDWYLLLISTWRMAFITELWADSIRCFSHNACCFLWILSVAYLENFSVNLLSYYFGALINDKVIMPSHHVRTLCFVIHIVFVKVV